MVQTTQFGQIVIDSLISPTPFKINFSFLNQHIKTAIIVGFRTDETLQCLILNQVIEWRSDQCTV